MTADTVEVDLLGSLPESVVLAAPFAAVCMFILWLPAVRLSWAICHELEGQVARTLFQPSCGGGCLRWRLAFEFQRKTLHDFDGYRSHIPAHPTLMGCGFLSGAAALGL